MSSSSSSKASRKGSTLCVVLADFEASKSSELTVKAGQKVYRFQENGEWSWCTLDGKQKGWIPTNFIQPVKPVSVEEQQAAMTEFVELNRKYFETLLAVRDLVINPVCHSDRKLLSEDDIAVIFRNLEDIIADHVRFMEHLQDLLPEEKGTPSTVDFTRFTELLLGYDVHEKYLEYVSSNDDALDRLHQILNDQSTHNRERYRAFQERNREVQRHPRSHCLNIEALLAEPLYFLPKFSQALQKVADHTPAEASHFAMLKGCANLFAQTSDQFRKQLTLLNQRKEIMNIAESISGFDHSGDSLYIPGRRYIRAGELFVYLKGGNHGVYMFFLFNDMLLYTPAAKRGWRYTNPVTVTFDDKSDLRLLKNCRAENGEPAYGWAIITAQQTLKVYSMNEKIRLSWLQSLIKVIGRYKSEVAKKQQQEEQDKKAAEEEEKRTEKPDAAGARPQPAADTPTASAPPTPRPPAAADGSESSPVPIPCATAPDGSIPSPSSAAATPCTAIPLAPTAAPKMPFLGPVAATDFQPHPEVHRCPQCGLKFGLFQRKHSCQCCGKVVCAGCSRTRAVMDWSDGVRVRQCDRCAVAHRTYQEELQAWKAQASAVTASGKPAVVATAAGTDGKTTATLPPTASPVPVDSLPKAPTAVTRRRPSVSTLRVQPRPPSSPSPIQKQQPSQTGKTAAAPPAMSAAPKARQSLSRSSKSGEKSSTGGGRDSLNSESRSTSSSASGMDTGEASSSAGKDIEPDMENRAWFWVQDIASGNMMAAYKVDESELRSRTADLLERSSAVPGSRARAILKLKAGDGSSAYRSLDGQTVYAGDARVLSPIQPEDVKHLLSPMDDLVFMQLTEFSEPSLLHQLRQRYIKDIIYTSVGDMLISINPYKPLPLYTHSITRAYQKADSQLVSTILPPHVFGVTSRAYSGLVEEHRNQCILITGESGAGKTETTKIVLQYLSDVAIMSAQDASRKYRRGVHGRRRARTVEEEGLFLDSEEDSSDYESDPGDAEDPGTRDGKARLSSLPSAKSPRGRKEIRRAARAAALTVEQLLSSNYLLESFGNAQTLRNDNSSRFGKCLTLRFKDHRWIVGGEVETYLLEKSRVVGGQDSHTVFLPLSPNSVGRTLTEIDRLQSRAFGAGQRNFHIFYQMCAFVEQSNLRDGYLPAGKKSSAAAVSPPSAAPAAMAAPKAIPSAIKPEQRTVAATDRAAQAQLQQQQQQQKFSYEGFESELELLRSLGLTGAAHFSYLRVNPDPESGLTTTEDGTSLVSGHRIEGVKDEEQMKTTFRALAEMGVSPEDTANLLTVLAGLLHLGNLHLVPVVPGSAGDSPLSAKPPAAPAGGNGETQQKQQQQRRFRFDTQTGERIDMPSSSPASSQNEGHDSHGPAGEEDLRFTLDPERLHHAAGVLGVSGQGLEDLLRWRLLRVGGREGTEAARSRNSPKEALSTRDALAKELYRRLFDWLVLRTNTHFRRERLAQLQQQEVEGSSPGPEEQPRSRTNRTSATRKPKSQASSAASGEVTERRKQGDGAAAAAGDNPREEDGGSISVLDIFGFESLETNHLEQFFINYANEKLQQFYNDFLFRREQTIYASEGIRVDKIAYTDNRLCLELIENRTGVPGILQLLDEEISFRRKNVRKRSPPSSGEESRSPSSPHERSGRRHMRTRSATTSSGLGGLGRSTPRHRQKSPSTSSTGLPGSGGGSDGPSSLGVEEAIVVGESDAKVLQRMLDLYDNPNGLNHNPFFKRVVHTAHEFGIRHYADTVVYDIRSFVEKNMDRVDEECVKLLATSSCPLIAELFRKDLEDPEAEEEEERRRQEEEKQAKMSFLDRQRAQLLAKNQAAPDLEQAREERRRLREQKETIQASLGRKFRRQLDQLVNEVLQDSTPHFIRCINPNRAKRPYRWEAPMVLRQMRSSGLMEAIRIRKSGYPFRLPADKFLRRYALCGNWITRAAESWRRQLKLLRRNREREDASEEGGDSAARRKLRSLMEEAEEEEDEAQLQEKQKQKVSQALGTAVLGHSRVLQRLQAEEEEPQPLSPGEADDLFRQFREDRLSSPEAATEVCREWIAALRETCTRHSRLTDKYGFDADLFRIGKTKIFWTSSQQYALERLRKHLTTELDAAREALSRAEAEDSEEDSSDTEEDPEEIASALSGLRQPSPTTTFSKQGLGSNSVLVVASSELSTSHRPVSPHVNLRQVLRHPYLRHCLGLYLHSNYCAENLLFLDVVEEFRRRWLHSSPEALTDLVGFIAKTYISEESSDQVNIASHNRAQLMARIKGIRVKLEELREAQESGQQFVPITLESLGLELGLFDKAVDEIIQLVERDVFSRFRHDQVFRFAIRRSWLQHFPAVLAQSPGNSSVRSQGSESLSGSSSSSSETGTSRNSGMIQLQMKFDQYLGGLQWLSYGCWPFGETNWIQSPQTELLQLLQMAGKCSLEKFPRLRPPKSGLFSGRKKKKKSAAVTPAETEASDYKRRADKFTFQRIPLQKPLTLLPKLNRAALKEAERQDAEARKSDDPDRRKQLNLSVLSSSGIGGGSSSSSFSEEDSSRRRGGLDEDGVPLELCLSDPAFHELSRTAFRNILSFMGVTFHAYPVTCGLALLKDGHEYPLLRDELYCQVVKQCTPAPPDYPQADRRQTLLAWHLLFAMIHAFLPLSVDAGKMLISHVAQFARRSSFRQLQENGIRDFTSVENVATYILLDWPALQRSPPEEQPLAVTQEQLDALYNLSSLSKDALQQLANQHTILLQEPEGFEDNPTVARSRGFSELLGRLEPPAGPLGPKGFARRRSTLMFAASVAASSRGRRLSTAIIPEDAVPEEPTKSLFEPDNAPLEIHEEALQQPTRGRRLTVDTSFSGYSQGPQSAQAEQRRRRQSSANVQTLPSQWQRMGDLSQLRPDADGSPPNSASSSAAAPGALVQCGECQTNVFPGMTVCSACGADVLPSTVSSGKPAPPPGIAVPSIGAARFCHACSTRLLHGQNFCSNCGQRYNPNAGAAGGKFPRALPPRAPRSPSVMETEDQHCSKCDAPVASHLRFCTACGGPAVRK